MIETFEVYQGYLQGLWVDKDVATGKIPVAALSGFHQLYKLRQISADCQSLILLELYITISNFIR